MSVKHKNRWSRTPKAGTKSNETFRKLLVGLSSREMSRNDRGVMNKLETECGFDIRRFKGQPDGKKIVGCRGSANRPNIYKIVGRYKWNGGYVSFTEKYADE